MPNERIVLAHREPIFRYGTRVILERAGFSVISDVATGLEAIQAVKTYDPDVLIIGGVSTGVAELDVARELRSSGFGTRLVFLVEGPAPFELSEIVSSGFVSCVQSSQDADVLVSAIHEVLDGAAVYWFSGQGTSGVKGKVELSPRERQVLQLLATGVSKKETAERLGISVRTVEAHRNSIMLKLDIHTIAGLVRFAIRTGVIDP